ncbi:hypothetical protein CVT24_007676 [Panaeolus cyanescens]|uniref:Isochorismatase-like domain-containing protein n=1 Tax=Panaeolus cyanescens TaxID=181874 RepID=A0A409VRK6_9AGAR|nr:hypothetical protein CVT24_007676 [Panaeolus cyanescens]
MQRQKPLKEEHKMVEACQELISLISGSSAIRSASAIMEFLTKIFTIAILAFPTLVCGEGIPTISSDPQIFGNPLNFWKKLPTGGWDLTRGRNDGAITLPMTSGGPIIVHPNSTALVIIDMQNFFLHESLRGDPKGRDVVLINMPPAFIKGFAGDGTSATSFGSDMGTIVVPSSDPSIPATSSTHGTNQTIQVGKKLMRGSWNAQPWGPLFEEQVKGVADGTDFYFNKNRLSGMWGPGTPMQTWLQDNSMTTLFFGGVNVDQCVWGTFLDAYYKGYDVILVDDMSATTSPASATAMVDYNAAIDGWRTSSPGVVDALRKASTH